MVIRSPCTQSTKRGTQAAADRVPAPMRAIAWSTHRSIISSWRNAKPTCPPPDRMHRAYTARSASGISTSTSAPTSACRRSVPRRRRARCPQSPRAPANRRAPALRFCACLLRSCDGVLSLLAVACKLGPSPRSVSACVASSAPLSPSAGSSVFSSWPPACLGRLVCRGRPFAAGDLSRCRRLLFSAAAAVAPRCSRSRFCVLPSRCGPTMGTGHDAGSLWAMPTLEPSQ